MDDLQKVIQRLSIQGEPPQQPVNPIGTQGDFASRVGVGTRSDTTQASESDVTISTMLYEVVTVYSYTLVTESGAFEVPPSYPTDGVYAVGGQTYSTLPDILTASGSIYTLDTTAAIYKQRRVHASYFKSEGKSGITMQAYHIEIEQPYQKMAYGIGLNLFGMSNTSSVFSSISTVPSAAPIHGGRDVKCYYTSNPYFSQDPQVIDLTNQLRGLGFVLES